MIQWRPITAFEPEGNGTVLLFCSETSWVRTAAAQAVVGQYPSEIEPGNNYRFTHFAYIDHLDCIPSYHPFYELIRINSGSQREHDILSGTIGRRAESYDEFTKDDNTRYYSGQSNSHLHWMCEGEYRFLFKTKEECLLGEIALGRQALKSQID